MRVLTLRLDSECLDLLKKLRAEWPSVMAAHQSNIVREVVEMADTSAELEGTPLRAFSVGSNLCPGDLERLRQVADAWQFLSRRQCVEVLENARFVASDA